MAEPTPTQEASRKFAEAVFANPELAERFEMMAKETATREPIPDDFSWLSRDAEPQQFSRFKTLTRKLLDVPKHAIDAERAKRR
jgi:uncharacterized protein (DUF1786 family)